MVNCGSREYIRFERINNLKEYSLIEKMFFPKSDDQYYEGSINTCEGGCCNIYRRLPVVAPRSIVWKYDRKKAGAFLYRVQKKFGDENTLILIVQSHGEKWGMPKGSIEDQDKSLEECAIREVREETGIDISPPFEETVTINRTLYYIIELSSVASNELDMSKIESDITGITWIRVGCLRKLTQLGIIDTNSHCKKILVRYFSPSKIEDGKDTSRVNSNLHANQIH